MPARLRLRAPPALELPAGVALAAVVLAQVLQTNQLLLPQAPRKP